MTGLKTPTIQLITRPPRCPEIGLVKAVVARDMPEPCDFPFLDLTVPRKRCLRSHREVDLAPHSLVSFALEVGDAREVSSDT